MTSLVERLQARCKRASPWLGLGSLVILAAITMVVGYRRWAAHEYIFDDAFISFRYASNLLEGHGLVFNPGERVEGYTNFLWVLLVAFGMRLGIDPVVFTRILGVGSYLLSIALVAALWKRVARGRAGSLLFASPLLLCLCFHAHYPESIASGLETTFASALFLGLAHTVASGSRTARRYGTALVSIVLVLTRLDGAIAVAAAGIAMLWAPADPGRLPWRSRVAELLWTFGPVVVVVGLYVAWKLVYYGDVFPNTYYAKRAYEFRVDAGLDYFATYIRAAPHALLLLTLATVGAFNKHARTASVYAGVTLALAGLYIIKVGGDFMEFRFIWEYYPLLVALAGIGLLGLAELSQLPALALAAAASALALMPLGKLRTDFGMQSLKEMNRYAEDGQRVGKALGARLPSSTVVSTTLAGTIAYYSKLELIDQWGLNDKYVARLPGGNAKRGHVKFAPLSYLRERGVNLYLEHPVTCRCDHPCREGSKANVFVRLDEWSCVRAWYLVQDDTLTQYFCDHPDDFVLNNVECQGGGLTEQDKRELERVFAR